MTDAFSVAIDDQRVLAALAKLAERFTPAGMAPAMREIGEVLTESSKQRFSTSTAPDGSPWAPLAPGTVLSRLAEIGGAYSPKNGRLTKNGIHAVTGMKPLIDTGALQGTLHYQLFDGGAGVEVGTNRMYGEWDDGATGNRYGPAVHQFGSRDGDIPARPFLGLSSKDRTEVLSILDQFLENGAA